VVWKNLTEFEDDQPFFFKGLKMTNLTIKMHCHFYLNWQVQSLQKAKCQNKATDSQFRVPVFNKLINNQEAKKHRRLVQEHKVHSAELQVNLK